MEVKVYVSSTYDDLEVCREQVRRALQKLDGVRDVAMETYVAGEERPLDKCLSDVRNCDLYIGVFAWRYGYVPLPNNKSITELEYMAAGESGKERLIFLLHEDAPWPRSKMEQGRGGARIVRLRKELSERHGCDIFTSCDHLASLVTSAVAHWLQRRRQFRPTQLAAVPQATGQFLDHLTDSTTFNPVAVTDFRGEMRKEVIASYPSNLTASEFLQRVGVRVDGRLTRTGVLLFGERPNAFWPTPIVKCARYYALDRGSNRVIDTASGTVRSQIFDAYQFVADHVQQGEAPSPGSVQSSPVYDYPMIAVREIIVNALVHRDYSAYDKSVHVRIFPDRLEVSSPGPWCGRDLDPGVEYRLADLKGQSVRRNSALANFLSWIKLFEGDGSGIPSTLQDCRTHGVEEPNVLQDAQGFVTVTLRRRQKQENASTRTSRIDHTGHAAPLRVFLSHTPDLGRPTEPGSFVAAAVEAVLRARHGVTDMAYFAARDTSPAAVCREMVAQSDVYVGIIGMRYGSPVRDQPDVSYTELEFEAAGERGQPRLVYLIHDDSDRLPAYAEPPELRARQDAFRRRLRDSGLTVVRVGSPAELELAVFHTLVELGPALDGPARLAEAQALLASMPANTLPDRAPLPAGSRMPLAPNPLFVGRGDELQQVAAALKGDDTTVAVGQVIASTGLGGLGKTQLAVELVHRYGRYFAGGVFWFSFASPDEVPLQVAACAGLSFEARPLEERVQRVKDAWQGAVPRLLVFDNCEDEALLDAWRPSSGGCRVLVTSRRSTWSPTLGVAVLPLDLLPRSDSIALLRRYRPDLAANDPGLDALAAELGDLPLALHLAGSYLRTYRAEVGLDGYLAELQRSDVVQHASLLGAGLTDSVSPTHHVQGVAQTFALCLGRLDREREADQVAIALLARMACMAPGEPVPRDLIAKTLDGVDARLRSDGLHRLAGVGLVEEGEGWLRLHRLLVHFVRQEELDPTAPPAVVRTLVGCGEDARHRRLTGSALAAVIPHLVDVAGVASAGGGDQRLAAELYAAVGRAMYRAGDPRGAKPWYERALVSREQILGPAHSDTAGSLNDLGVLLCAQGEWATARSLLEHALASREQTLGPDHPDTAESLNDLGVLLSAQGELAAASLLYERALTIRQRVLGPDHPDTAFSLNNLAVLLHDRGELAAASPLLERALAIQQRVLGPDHPDTAESLNNLATLLRDQGELAAARPLYERALAILERALGPEHPDTARSLNNLGALLQAQGELSAAKPLVERALGIQERVLGPNSPHSASSLNNLARLHRDQGDPAAARPLFERALAIRERVLGPDHPDTVATRRALEELAGDGDGAEAGG